MLSNNGDTCVAPVFSSSSFSCFPFEKKKKIFCSQIVVVVVVVLLNELISRKGHNGWKLPGLSSKQ